MLKKKEEMVTKVEKEVATEVRRQKDLPAIPEERLDAVIDLSDDQATWIKIVEGGFRVTNQDKFLRFLVGRIVDVTPYLIKFDGGVPEKIPHTPDDLQIPAGFERRCDVKLLVENQLIGLSLPPSSLKFYLSPYLKFLKNKGLRPEQVLTKITSKQASNAQGTWAVACFELVDAPTGSSKPPSSSSQPAIPVEWS